MPGARTLAGPLFQAVLSRAGRTLVTRYSLTGIGEDFRASSGFLSRVGVANGTLDHLVAWYGPTGGLFESVSQDVLLNATWQYSGFVL